MLNYNVVNALRSADAPRAGSRRLLRHPRQAQPAATLATTVSTIADAAPGPDANAPLHRKSHSLIGITQHRGDRLGVDVRDGTERG